MLKILWSTQLKEQNGKSNALSGRPINEASCLCAGSKVLQQDGNYIFIEDLKIGDSVITYDLKSKSFSTSIVLGLALLNIIIWLNYILKA